MYVCMYILPHEEIHLSLLLRCNLSFLNTLKFRTEQISLRWLALTPYHHLHGYTKKAGLMTISVFMLSVYSEAMNLSISASS